MSAFGGRTDGRTEEGKGETNGCKMEKRNGFIAATDTTNNRATPAPPPCDTALLIPSGQIRERGGRGRGEAGRCLGRLISETGPRSTAAEDHLMYKTDRQTGRQTSFPPSLSIYRRRVILPILFLRYARQQGRKEGKKALQIKLAPCSLARSFFSLP